MSHDEKTSRSFEGLMHALDVADLHASIEYLARQVAKLKGLDFETDGSAIITEATEAGKNIVWERRNKAFLKIVDQSNEFPGTCPDGKPHDWEKTWPTDQHIGASIQYRCKRCPAKTALLPSGSPPPT